MKCFAVPSPSSIPIVLMVVVVMFSFCDAGTSSTRRQNDGKGADKGNSNNDNSSNNENNKLILISLDGFRWNYLNGRAKAKTPTFDKLKKKGVHATHGIENVFVTNTLPNHFTLVTGLYSENHGMLDNYIWDSSMDKPYVSVFYDPEAFNHPDWLKSVGEPIWVSNQIQTQRNGSSGVLMWMGGESPIRGVQPDKFHPHSYTMGEMAEMQLLVDWLTDDHRPVDLAVVYVPEPDYSGHLYGPESQEVTDKIQDLDTSLAFLLDQLDKAGLSDHTDVIVTSDHGFVEVSEKKSIQMDDILDPTSYSSVSALPGPTLALFPLHGKEDEVYRRLEAAANEAGTFQVYRKSDIPSRFRYKNHRRAPPIFAMADAGYSFVNRKSIPGFQQLKGNHGYDNALQSMRPFFMAFGPSFREDVSVETFRNVDIYPLMCHILGLRPAPNNGSMATVGKLLRHYKGEVSAEEVKVEL